MLRRKTNNNNYFELNLVPALPAENIGGGDCSGGAPTPAAHAGKVSRGGAGHVQLADHQQEEDRLTDLHHVMTAECWGARSCACVRAGNCAQTPPDYDMTVNGTAPQCTCIENDVHAQVVTDPEQDISTDLTTKRCACTDCAHAHRTDQVQDNDTTANNVTLPTKTKEGHSRGKVSTGPGHSKVLAMVRMVEDKIRDREKEKDRIIKKAGRRKIRDLKPSVQQKITALFGNFENRGREQQVGGEGREVRDQGAGGQHDVCDDICGDGVRDRIKRRRPSGMEDSPAKKTKQ